MRQMKLLFTMSGILVVLAMALMLPAGAVAGSKYKTLYRFTSVAGGRYPIDSSGLIFDAAGNLYGTTERGGASRRGTVFELTPNSDGRWTESVLYSFTGGTDGSEPRTGLISTRRGIFTARPPRAVLLEGASSSS